MTRPPLACGLTGYPVLPWSGGLQINGGLFAGAAVCLDLIGDLLAFRETTQAGAFNRTDVHEQVMSR